MLTAADQFPFTAVVHRWYNNGKYRNYFYSDRLPFVLSRIKLRLPPFAPGEFLLLSYWSSKVVQDILPLYPMSYRKSKCRDIQRLTRCREFRLQVFSLCCSRGLISAVRIRYFVHLIRIGMY